MYSQLYIFCRLELEVEPIFASMALYDAKERKKVGICLLKDNAYKALKKLFVCNYLCYLYP